MHCSFDKHFRLFFFHYGRFLYKFRYIVPIISLVLTGGLCYGLTYLEERTVKDTDYLFAPLNSRWKEEKAAFDKAFPVRDLYSFPGRSLAQKEWIDMVLTVEGGGNILDHLDEALELEDYIYSNITVRNSSNGKDYGYQHLCLRMSEKGGCYQNRDHITFFRDNSDQWTKFDTDSIVRDIAKSTVQSQLIVKYPISLLSGGRFYVGNVLGGVKKAENLSSQTRAESSFPIQYAQSLRMFFTFLEDSESKELSQELILKIQHFVLNGSLHNNLSVAIFHERTIGQGLYQQAEAMKGVFSITFILLTLFATLCSMVSYRPVGSQLMAIDWIRSKPGVALVGVLTAGMGLASAYGFLLICGFLYSEMNSVMPFLVISIGIDDMFILSAAWHRTRGWKETGDRLGRTMSEAAVSITITSLTDFLSFAVGCSTPIPGIVSLCTYLAAGVAFNYIYQITFFAAILGIFGDLEDKGRNSLLPCIPAKSDSHTNSACIRFLNSGVTTKEPTSVQNRPNFSKKISDKNQQPLENWSSSQEMEIEGILPMLFEKYWGPFIMRPSIKVASVLLYLVYLGLTIWGILTIRQGMLLKNLTQKDFYLNDYATAMEETFWAQGEQMSVLVSSPPDLATGKGRQEMEWVLGNFSDTEHSMGRLYTVFWLDDFLPWRRKLEAQGAESPPFWEDVREEWLSTAPRKEEYKMDIVWESDEWGSPGYYNATAVRFLIGLRNFVHPEEHRSATELFREIGDRFPAMNISTYHEFSPMAEWLMLLVPTTLRNQGIAIGCMFIVSLIFIPSLACAVLVALAVVSIDVGVFGFMSLWSVNFDSISAVCILMSVGFAVDLTAHISYAFISAKGEPDERAIAALKNLGTPILQGGVSTILGMLVLLSVGGYTLNVFFKTVFLVIFFGLLHSLLWIPVALSQLIALTTHCKPKRVTHQKDPDFNRYQLLERYVETNVKHSSGKVGDMVWCTIDHISDTDDDPLNSTFTSRYRSLIQG